MFWGKLTLIVGGALLPVLSIAQTIAVDQASFLGRLDRIERRLMALEQKLFATGAGSVGQVNMSDYELRLQEIERESTGLYGSVEKLGNGMNRLVTRLERLAQDMEMRLQDLEAKAMHSAANPAPATQITQKDTKPKAPKAIPETARPKALDIPEDIEPQKLYKSAYNYLVAAQYPIAQEWLEAFLERFPEHELADNAHYWLGEVYLVQGSMEKAVIAFKNGLSNFPTGMKAAGNLLKMGVALKQLGQPHHAKSAWKKVMDYYPDSPEASKAKAYLENKNPANG